jgi:hypothetical protein
MIHCTSTYAHTFINIYRKTLDTLQALESNKSVMDNDDDDDNNNNNNNNNKNNNNISTFSMSLICCDFFTCALTFPRNLL